MGEKLENVKKAICERLVAYGLADTRILHILDLVDAACDAAEEEVKDEQE